MEGIYADTNLGILLLESGRYGDAATVFENSLADREKLAANAPEDVQFRKALISVLAWLGEAREKEGRLDDGLAQRERQISLLQPYINDTKSDAQYRRDALVAYRAAGRTQHRPRKSVQGPGTAANVGTDRRRADRGRAAECRLGSYDGLREVRTRPDRACAAERRTSRRFDALRLRHGRQACREGLERSRLAARPSSLVFQLKARIAVAQGALVEAEGLADRLQQLARSEIAKTPSADAQLELANAELLRGLVAYASGSRAKAGAAFREAARSWPRQMPDRPPLLARKVLILTGIGRRDAANALALQLARMGYRDPTYMRDRALLGS